MWQKLGASANFSIFSPHYGPNLHVKPFSLPVEYCVMYLRSHLKPSSDWKAYWAKIRVGDSEKTGCDSQFWGILTICRP